MDVLTLLRQYISKDQPYKANATSVEFDGLSFPLNTNTKFIIYGTGRDGQKLNHIAYVQAATASKIPHIRRPDRANLLNYLKGAVNDLESIDRSVVPINNDKTEPIEDSNANISSNELLEASTALPMKTIKIPDRLSQKITKTKNAEPSIRPLSDKLPKEVVQQLRAKALAKRRNRIVESEGQEAVFSQVVSDHTDISKEMIDRERVWRDRTSILQSVYKEFTHNVDAILSAVKAREDGKGRLLNDSNVDLRKNAVESLHGKTNSNIANTGYSRYDQERFGTRDETDDFEIDIHGTYHGMSLKSVTEGAIVKKPKLIQPIRPNPVDKPKRVSRTPIIIIPAGVVSTITMLNAKDILQDLRFVSNEVKRQQGLKRDIEILLQRKKSNGSTVPFRVIDNITKLTPDDWTDRVVAVFCQGPAWQFKGWPWGGNPTDIFQRVIAFHLHLSGMQIDQNIARWNVNIIELDNHKRHLDRARLLVFWEKLNRFIVEHKPHLRY
ncbi:hypothetical protein GJ496_006549 [Pomphorhynchus laevis]|nr:hypothetical protein GJ496_006549 [Pomphorhynchus laevis]